MCGWSEPTAHDRTGSSGRYHVASSTNLSPASRDGVPEPGIAPQKTGDIMVDEPIRVRVLRPEDLLVLDISLINLAVGGDGHLHVVDQMTPGRIVFELPPQHLAEAAFLENETSSQVVSPLPVRSVSAAPSRLAFDVRGRRAGNSLHDRRTARLGRAPPGSRAQRTPSRYADQLRRGPPRRAGQRCHRTGARLPADPLAGRRTRVAASRGAAHSGRHHRAVAHPADGCRSARPPRHPRTYDEPVPHLALRKRHRRPGHA